MRVKFEETKWEGKKLQLIVVDPSDHAPTRLLLFVFWNQELFAPLILRIFVIL